MELTKLQSILLPDRQICAEDELYFRIKSAHYDEMGRKLVFQKYAHCKFNTYFNSFSLNKWIYYTKINSLYLKLNLKGEFVLRVFSSWLDDEEADSSLIFMEKIEASKECLIEVPISSIKDGSIYFELEALEKDCEFYGGEWCTSIEENEIGQSKIAVVICTYKREAYIKQNVDLINEQFYEHTNSSLKDELYIYIVDNGQTLNSQELANSNVQVIPNINAGGAGGFTRGMIAAYEDKEKYALTHILLMDDDVRVEPESIARTLNFLKLLKPEFADAFIGGSMVRLDKPSVIHESGALFGLRGFAPLKHNLDVKYWDNVLFNEIPETIHFFGWWYCAIPMSIDSKENLPLPLFIRLDDVEYGLRNMRHSITLNGILIWHEPFERRHNSMMEYYYVRNFLIIGASRNITNKTSKVIRLLLNKTIMNLLHYNYGECNQVFDAVEDFFKGLDWLIAQDPGTLHAQISSKTDKLQDVRELNFGFHIGQYYNSLNNRDRGLKRLFRLLTVNGYFLPANRHTIVTNDITQNRKRIINMYRAKRVMQYDITTNRGVVYKRSLSKAFSIMVRFFLISIKLMFNLQRKNDEYRKKLPSVQTKRFWTEFLKLE